MARRPQSPRPTSSRGADGLKDGEAAGSILSKPLSEKDLSSSVSCVHGPFWHVGH